LETSPGSGVRDSTQFQIEEYRVPRVQCNEKPSRYERFHIQIVSIPPPNPVRNELLLGLSKTDGSLAEVVD
jgi:hypothetical protein